MTTQALTKSGKPIVRQNSGGRPKTGADAIAVRKRHVEWLELKSHGATYDEIAEQYGVTKNAVYQAVVKLLQEMPVEGVADLRALEVRRLDRQLGRLERSAKSLTSIDGLPPGDGYTQVEACIVQNSARRAKLLGLDAPQKVEVQTQTVELEELRRLLNSCGYDIVPLVPLLNGETE